jgi:hypothetical protein
LAQTRESSADFAKARALAQGSEGQIVPPFSGKYLFTAGEMGMSLK